MGILFKRQHPTPPDRPKTEFKCARCGARTAPLPMDTPRTRALCPSCGGPARRS